MQNVCKFGCSHLGFAANDSSRQHLNRRICLLLKGDTNVTSMALALEGGRMGVGGEGRYVMHLFGKYLSTHLRNDAHLHAPMYMLQLLLLAGANIPPKALAGEVVARREGQCGKR